MLIPLGEGHLGLRDFRVQVIDCTNVNNPTEREFLDLKIKLLCATWA